MWHLLGDIGGTNLRLVAMDDAGSLGPRVDGPMGKDGILLEACMALCRKIGAPPASVTLALAGVIEEDRVRFTNLSQSVARAEIAMACEVRETSVTLLNDFEAAAWSLAELNDITYLQGGPQSGARVIIGPGTGLGVGALVPGEPRPRALPGEGGHVRLTPHSAEEVGWFEALIDLWPEVRMGDALAVEAEAILSGTGMPLWYRAIAMSRGEAAPLTEAETVFGAARRGEDANATRAVESFARYLGGLAGDLGLAFGARGGVFITGGVAQANAWIFGDGFRGAFNAGGRHGDWRRAMPLGLCRDPDFGLAGARKWRRAHMD